MLCGDSFCHAVSSIGHATTCDMESDRYVADRRGDASTHER